MFIELLSNNENCDKNLNSQQDENFTSVIISLLEVPSVQLYSNACIGKEHLEVRRPN